MLLDAWYAHDATWQFPTIGELTVHLIGKQEQVILLDQFRQTLEICICIIRSGRVAWIAN